MLKLMGVVPQQIYVACSGGPDSMAVLDFLRRGNRNIRVLHVDHGDEYSPGFEAVVEDYCGKNGLEVVTRRIPPGARPGPDESLEEFWRNHRLQFFTSFDYPVVTAHNLDDAVETWLFGSFNGQPKLIPYSYQNVIRPFLLTYKEDLKDWCTSNGIHYAQDPLNTDVSFARARIRNRILPEVLKVNPGIHTVIRKKLQERFERTRDEHVDSGGANREAGSYTGFGPAI